MISFEHLKWLKDQAQHHHDSDCQCVQDYEIVRIIDELVKLQNLAKLARQAVNTYNIDELEDEPLNKALEEAFA